MRSSPPFWPMGIGSDPPEIGCRFVEERATAKRKRGVPLGGERLLPDLPSAKGDPYEALRFEAQTKFLGAVSEHCQHVLSSLWSDIFAQRTARRFPGGEEDQKALDTWIERYNFREVKSRTAQPDLLRCRVCSTWLEHAAQLTLGEWHNRLRVDLTHERPPAPERPQKLEFVFGQDTGFSPEGSVRKPRYYRHEILAGKLDEERARLPGDDPLHSVPLMVRFWFPAFEPFEERAADWKERCRRSFEGALASHLAERDPGGPRTPKMIEPEHFTWAALAVCGDNADGTFGWTLTRIQKFAGRGSVSTVHRAVHNVLNLIGIEIKRRRGRPRRTREGRSRHVARS